MTTKVRTTATVRSRSPRSRSTSKGKKAMEKKDGKDPGLEPMPAASPASKRSKSGNGEKISAFVQECLKTLALKVSNVGLEGNAGTQVAVAASSLAKPMEAPSEQAGEGQWPLARRVEGWWKHGVSR